MVASPLKRNGKIKVVSKNMKSSESVIAIQQIKKKATYKGELQSYLDELFGIYCKK